ncbi:hypothetical protein K437DRAFT_239542 [Tilletiaria anomala UBC 951]|uniref:Phosphoglycerate mutase-like protein n=1 Tax=Tilletiaria anomala (strain ATCC 24038 / CBS 436.72 / UBC 951) TaxID=1037660 RepID=A0A066VD86_TILAU|nr:uncharacterized protein K437DRAFT_239542 [Tilletiaria anomala UBC 951]KDN39396.1 hypothetical protein K437DRAFT_239542 [Tilletiaria anomala UBC 951]
MDPRPLTDSPEAFNRPLATAAASGPPSGQCRPPRRSPHTVSSSNSSFLITTSYVNPPNSIVTNYPLKSLLITLVRHGESQDDLRSICAGYRDSALSSTGQSQARAVGKSFADVPIVAIYSSDLKRAATTADEVLQQNNTIPPPILVQSQSLREQNFGQAEGKSWSSVERQTLPTAEDTRTAKFQDGESLEDVNARVATAVRRFILPRIEALRKEPVSATHKGAASAVGGNVPNDCPHIVIIAHGIAIQELLRVFMSLHESDPPGGLQAPWPDPKQSYRHVRLENSGWTRLEIAVPAAVPAPGRAPSSMGPGAVPAPTGTGVIASQSSGSEMDSGQIQTQLAEGSVDAQRPLPSAPTAGRSTFVRILVQNQTDHLKGVTMQLPTSGGPANMLSGGSGAIPDEGMRSGLTPSVSTPMMNTGSLSAGRSPHGLLATPASAKSLSAYDGRFLAREIEKATSNSATNESAMSNTTGASGGLVPSQSTPLLHPSALHAYSLQNMLNQTSAAATELAHVSTNGLSSISDTWQSICVKILPLFNGEGLKASFDELNALVGVHVRKVVQRGPARALDTLSAEIASLASSGMYTLNSRLSALQGEALLRQLVRVWIDYFGDIIPNVDASFLPVVTDPDIASLTKGKTPKAGAAMASQIAAPGISASMSTATPLSSLRTERIEVRQILLSVFRDEIIAPRYEQLFYLFAHIRNFSGEGEQDDDADEASDSNLYPRLLQMSNVVNSVQGEGEPQQMMESLLRVLRIGAKGGNDSELESLGLQSIGGAGTQGNQRQNRRGWLPRLALKHSNFTVPIPVRKREAPPMQAMSIGDEEDTMDASTQQYKDFLESDEFLEELKSGQNSHPCNNQASHAHTESRQGPRPPSLFDPRFSENDFLNSLRSPAQSDALSTPQRHTPDLSGSTLLSIGGGRDSSDPTRAKPQNQAKPQTHVHGQIQTPTQVGLPSTSAYASSSVIDVAQLSSSFMGLVTPICKAGPEMPQLLDATALREDGTPMRVPVFGEEEEIEKEEGQERQDHGSGASASLRLRQQGQQQQYSLSTPHTPGRNSSTRHEQQEGQTKVSTTQGDGTCRLEGSSREDNFLDGSTNTSTDLSTADATISATPTAVVNVH